MPRRIAYSDALTERDWDVLRALATGATDVEIADTLRIAFSTVRTHLEHIFVKVGVPARGGAIAWYWQHQHLDPATPA